MPETRTSAPPPSTYSWQPGGVPPKPAAPPLPPVPAAPPLPVVAVVAAPAPPVAVPLELLEQAATPATRTAEASLPAVSMRVSSGAGTRQYREVGQGPQAPSPVAELERH